MGTQPQIINNGIMEASKVYPAKTPEQMYQRPAIDGDPLLSFETFHFQVQTDLRLWMTFNKEERIKKAKEFVAGQKNIGHKNEANLSQMQKITPARRNKILNYLIYMESTHPLGDREVAAVAFNGLFGLPEAKK